MNIKYEKQIPYSFESSFPEEYRLSYYHTVYHTYIPEIYYYIHIREKVFFSSWKIVYMKHKSFLLYRITKAF